MKKIYSLIATAFLFLSGALHAQSPVVWETDGINVDSIQTGDDHYYLIQEGIQIRQSASGYLNCGPGDVLQKIDSTCIFSFYEDGEPKVVGDSIFKVYVMKNRCNGLYLKGDGDLRFTESLAKAYHFTIRRAKGYQAGDPNVDFNDWMVYSHFTEEITQAGGSGCNAGAEAAGAWIFCAPDQRLLIDCRGNCVTSDWPFTTNYFVLEATRYVPTAFEQYLEVFDQYFANGINEEDYLVGTAPGCISQEYLDKLLDLYSRALDATGQELTDEQCFALIKEIKDVMKEKDSAFVPMKPGYFLFYNENDGYAIAGETCPEFRQIMEKPTEWNVENSKLIWQFESTGEPNRFYIKSFYNQSYLRRQDGGRQTLELLYNKDSKTEFLAEPGVKGTFKFRDDVHYVAAVGGRLKHWGYNPDGSLNPWNFFSVEELPESVMSPLLEVAEQERQKQVLINLYNNCVSDLHQYEYANGFCNAGIYTQRGMGLVNSIVNANATDTEEGSVEGMFDGKLDTYYHTSWHSNVAPAGHHWITVDLGKDVSELIVKFTERHNAHNGDPVQFKMFAPEKDGFEKEEWPVELAGTTEPIKYQYASELGDSTTFVGRYKLSVPTRYIRFVVTETKGNQFPAGEGSGPCWHVSELRFYDAADCVPNPALDLIPQEIKENLKNALDAAKKMIESGKGSQECVDQLDKAYHAFLDAYPNPDALLEAISSYKNFAQYIFEKEGEMGYYEPGTKDAFLQVVNSVENESKTAVLTSAKIESLIETLRQAKAQIVVKFNTPEPGVYRLRMTADNGDPDHPDDAMNTYVASANADLTSSPVWGYKDDSDLSTRWNTLWQVEKNSDGKFSFKNLVNGLYIKNPYEGLSEDEQNQIGITTRLNYSTTPSYFTLQGAPVGGQIMFVMKENRYMRGSVQNMIGNVGRPMVVYGDFDDNHARFVFEPVTEEDALNSSFMLNATPNAPHIMTMPIELAFVYAGESQCAYEVLGLNENKLLLSPIEGKIPAGTPFIVVMGEDNIVELEPSATSLSELINADKVIEPIIKNGLVSAPRSIAPGHGFGYFFNGIVTVLEGKEVIEAGTGYFNKSLPTTTETSDVEFEIQGVISGEGTAIDKVVLPSSHNNNGIYTISGIKVRHNVQSGDIQSLPKGIYIVNGKKMIVK